LLNVAPSEIDIGLAWSQHYADLRCFGMIRASQDFLALWNDADPDLPILKEAKAEYAKLQ
jgi:hypothetical protein